MLTNTQIKSKFDLKDIIYLDDVKIKQLAGIGIRDLKDLVHAKSVEIVEILAIDHYLCLKIQQHANLLGSGKIPTNRLTKRGFLGWIDEIRYGLASKFVILTPDNTFIHYQDVNFNKIQEIINHPRVLIVGNAVGNSLSNNNLDNLLRETTLLGYRNDKDYLEKMINKESEMEFQGIYRRVKAGKKESINLDEFDIIEQQMVISAKIIDRLRYVKQDLSSSSRS